MSVLQNFFNNFKSHLATTAAFNSFPLSLLLFGLEALMDVQFTCPCGSLWHEDLPILLIAAPPFFAFMLMFLLTRPLSFYHKKKKGNACCLCLKSFLHCLIPPFVWVMLLLFDGDYYACSQSDWKGMYVYDEELQTKWCKPTGLNADREADLRGETLYHIVFSKVNAIFM